MRTETNEGVYSSTPPSFIIGRHIEGVSLNGLEYLLTEDGEYMEFPSIDDAKRFLAVSLDLDLDDPILTENFYYEETTKQTDHPQG